MSSPRCSLNFAKLKQIADWGVITRRFVDRCLYGMRWRELGYGAALTTPGSESGLAGTSESRARLPNAKFGRQLFQGPLTGVFTCSWLSPVLLESQKFPCRLESSLELRALDFDGGAREGGNSEAPSQKAWPCTLERMLLSIRSPREVLSAKHLTHTGQDRYQLF